MSTIRSPALEILEDNKAKPEQDVPRERVTKTAKNVATLSDLAKKTIDDLYGRNGSNGIAKWKRFTLLNDYLHGLRLGELTVLTGPTGSGKTTFLSEYSLDLAEQGVGTMWCNFELKNSRLCAMMVRQLYSTLIKPLDPATTEPEKMIKLIEDMCRKLPIYFTTFTGATNVDNILKTIINQNEIENVQHVIVDNLQFMLGSSGSTGINPFMIQDAVFSRFRQLATVKNIHVTMVIHPRKFAQPDIDQELSVHSLYGGGKASQEADNILLIQTRRNNQDHFSKYLQIAKNRYFGDVYMGDRMELTFHKASQRHSLIWRKHELESSWNNKSTNGSFKKNWKAEGR